MGMGKRLHLDLARLLTDRGLPFRENRGWLQLDCPMCGDTGRHLGYHPESGAFNCFKCGKHRQWEVIAKLFQLSLTEAGALCRLYGEQSGGLPKVPAKKLLQQSRLKFPYGTGPLQPEHLRYLYSRGVTKQLASFWGLLGTGMHGAFSHRVIAPIFDQAGRIVCYQGRDITDKNKSKYKSCPDDEAVVPIKDCLYGIEKVPSLERVIVTEGVTKVWRLGPGAIATFGAQVSDRQVETLLLFTRVYILFDDDEAGRKGSEQLAQQLSPFMAGGKKTEIITIPGVRDVADLSERDALSLMDALK